jgi:hypothetical protein
MSAAERAAGLLARAAHEATPPEEARTCGVLLAKLIVTHGLELHDPHECVPRDVYDAARERQHN